MLPLVRAGAIEKKFVATVNEAGVKPNDSRRIGLVLDCGDVCLQLRATQVRSRAVTDRDESEFITVEWTTSGMTVNQRSTDVKASFISCR